MMDGFAWTWIGIILFLSVLWEWSYRKLRADRDFWHEKAEDYRVMYESGSVEVGKWRRKADLAERKIEYLGVALEDGPWLPDSEYKGLLRFDWYEKAAKAVGEDSSKVVTSYDDLAGGFPEGEDFAAFHEAATGEEPAAAEKNGPDIERLLNDGKLDRFSEGEEVEDGS